MSLMNIYRPLLLRLYKGEWWSSIFSSVCLFFSFYCGIFLTYSKLERISFMLYCFPLACLFWTKSQMYYVTYIFMNEEDLLFLRGTCAVWIQHFNIINNNSGHWYFIRIQILSCFIKFIFWNFFCVWNYPYLNCDYKWLVDFFFFF